MSERPTGTVTFLFTDIEGSTTRWEHHPDAMRTALARHDALLRSLITASNGYVFKMVGDAVYAAFAVPADALAAAQAAQRAVAAEEWGEVGLLRVRMALHTGAVQSRDDDYFGPTLNRVARILSTGAGGQILLSSATVELVRDSLPAGTSLQDLGEHALKDLLRPEHVYQLTLPDLPSQFPALKSLTHQPHNLPVQPTPFLGREQEVDHVCHLLHRPEVRMVTLTGPGGMGKTRLSLQVAAELSDDFADGVFLVALASVSDAALVVPTIVQTLGIHEVAGQSLLALLKSTLKDKQQLLVLDNFEQVVEAAVQIAELLAACPRLKLLVTSRILLHLQAEREFPVPPLSLPNPRQLPDLVTLSQYEAVALFIQRAQAVKADFTVTNANAPAVAGICTRLDGLPLALELAAARVKFFAPHALLVRLDQGLSVLTGGARDVPARQQTLRGAIAWSYDLLSPQEQALFRRLSVFVDGWTWEAAEIVCQAAGTLELDLLEELLSLADKSLLRQQESAEGEPRFWMLQVLREFGLEVLTKAGEREATRQAYAEYYLSLAQQAEPHLKSAEQAHWVAQLEQDYENLRTALRFLLERAGQSQPNRSLYAQQALDLSVALQWFWVTHDVYVPEGLAFLQQALALSQELEAERRAAALLLAGMLAWTVGDFEEAERLFAESVSLYQGLKDKAGYATCLQRLGMTARVRTQYAQARQELQEAASLFDELGERWKRGQCLTELARIATETGQYEQARMLLSESLLLYEGLADQERQGWVRFLQARLFFISQLDPLYAQQLADSSSSHFRALGNIANRVYLLGLQGWMQLVQGNLVAARPLLEECLTIYKEAGGEGGDDSNMRLALAQLVALQGEPEAARQLYQHDLTLLRQLGAYKEYQARGLEGLAALEARGGVPATAARWWGTAQALREAIGVPLYPVDQAAYEQAVAATRRVLGEEAFAGAWQEGRTMPLEQVIEEALKTGDETS